jgi:mRNA interferase MazF
VTVLRGELYWADLNPVVGSEQGGSRPVLVVQADPVNRHATTTVVLALTSRPQRSGSPLTVALPMGEGGLTRASWAKVSQLRTISLRRLRGRIGVLGDERMREIDRAIREVLRLGAGEPSAP